MASDIQDSDHRFRIFQYFGFLIFAMSLHFRQQHESKANFVKLVKNGNSIQNGGSESDFLN
jgi:hypothetical protein